MARHRAKPNSTASHEVRRVRSGLRQLFGFGAAWQLFGFGLSVFVLAVTSLAFIPAMIAADGKVAWGAIVVGQAVGTIGAVAVGYGWEVFGPARIVGGSPTVRRAEYIESIRTRTTLLLPVSAIGAFSACALAPDEPQLAVAGAVSATSVGLTPAWYFVGLARPYAMLLLETIPRAGGTTIGIVLMHHGQSALIGLIGMFLGMVAGFTMSTAWVFWSTAHEGAEHVPPRALRSVLSSNRHGISAHLGIAAYYAAPLAIVSVVAPAIQPAFALADKIHKLIVVALAPASTVLQGWVPSATGSARNERAKVALAAGCGFAIVIGTGAVILVPVLVNWLGNGQISLSGGVIVLLAACISISFIELVVKVAALAPFERLHAATRGVMVGSIIGLPLVALGARFLGTTGAVGGVLAGLLVCIVVEWIESVRSIRPRRRDLARTAT